MPVPNAWRGMRVAAGMVMLAGALAAPQQIHAASQAWTNAPVDSNWANTNNWVARSIPGGINTINTDVASFTNALPVSGIGGVSNPITNDFDREIGGILFDSANCGAYVFGSSLDNNYLNIAQGTSDGIMMSAAVINPITFNQALRIRLPSSTNGRYNFTNNAVPATATMFIAAVTNTSASTRPMTLTLSGSNTGTNTIAHIDDQANASGAIQIFKEGAGRWILSGPNDIAQKTSAGLIAGVFVEGGTLEVQDPASLGTITVGNLYVTNSVLQIDNVTLNNAGITLRNGGTIRLSGVGTVNNVTMSTITGNSATLATTSAADAMTVTAVTAGAVDSVLHTTGPGMVSLPQGNTYIGKWSVDGGTLQISGTGALGTGGNLNINAGGVFDTTPIGAGLYILDTKALSANGTGTAVGSTAATISADPGGTVDFSSSALTLTFTPTSFAGDTGHPALFCSRGTLAFHGNSITVNNASGTPLGIGTYQLVHQASGNISSSGGFVTLMTGSGLAAGTIAEINAVGGDLNLVVSSYTPKPLVWTGNDPLLPGVWDRQTSTNWLAGSTPSTFNIYDQVTFNSTGSAHPSVSLAAVMQPSSVVVDTSANDYTFTGAGQIAGGTSLVKINSGTLNLQTPNTYSGGTIVSNGVIKLGIDGGLPSTGPTGTNDVTIYSPGVFDLNNFTNAINGLNGNGTIDITGGNTSTLEFGFNGDSGLFSGAIQNTSGTLGIIKTGTGTETLTASNSYVGPTIIDLGTLRVTNQYALGAGNSLVAISNGILDMNTSLIVSNLNGGGFVINSSTATNTLTVQTDSIYSGIISGKIGVFVNAGTLRLNGANTYSNGTILAANATLAIGSGAANPGPGTVIASNNVTISQVTTGPASTFAPPVTTVDGATVKFTSGTTQNSWGNQFNGSALATNIFSGGNMSIGGALSFSNFAGTVIITNGGVRWFNASGGGDNTMFDFMANGGCFARDNVDVIHLGALFGNGSITGPSVSSPATYLIGGKGIDSEYSGTITGSNNIVKVGPGTLTLDGFTQSVLSTDSTTFTNYEYDTAISNLNSTTISNGVLALASPNNLNASPTITLANPTATLDVSSMGYVTNFTDLGGNADSAIVTNGILTLVAYTQMGAPQVLWGVGGIKGNGVINNGTIHPGLPGVAGTLTITNALGVLAGATNAFDLSDDASGVNAASDLLSVQGSIGLQGSSFIGLNALKGTINTGKYQLIKYTGALTNESGVVPLGTVPNLTIGGTLPATTRASMVLSNGNGELDVFVTSLNTTNLVWSGADVTNVWDIVGAFNWTNSLAAASMQYYQQDNVTFDDTALTNTVVLVGSLAPTTLTVNTASNYLFGGSGNIIGDTVLTKAGAGSLTLTNTTGDTYNGGTIVNSGVLKAGTDSGGNQNDLAFGTGPITVNTGGELRFGGNGGGTVVNHFITNAIIVNGGVVKAQDGAQHLTNSTVMINAAGGSLQTVFSTKNLVLDSPLNGTGNVTIASSVPTNAAGQVILNNPTNQISGTVTISTNGNLALTGFAGLSNSVTIDVQQGGVLDFTARSNSSWAVVSGQTLKGNGIIRGKSLTAAAGSTVAPGITGALGTLTVTNNSSTNFAVLTLNGTTLMDINRASAINSDRIVNASGTNIFGGTLTVNNLGAAPQAGDTFQLFTSGINTGGFTTLNLPTLATGLSWSNSLVANGKLTVISVPVAPTISPAITNFSLAGTSVTLSGTNGQQGATYYLLSTTNVALPINQWKTVATNVAGGGNFSFTDTNTVTSSAAQQFYLLSSTNYNP